MVIGERKRDWRGRFIRKMGPQPHGWLIWSKKWNCWHRRSMTGGACGYTRNIYDAGIFPREKAASYHDGYDNEAIHLSTKIAEIREQVGRARAEARTLETMLEVATQ